MSHIFLFVGVKIGSRTAFHCFVLQRKLIYSILENDLPVTTKRFKGLHTDNVREKSSSEREGVHVICWWYSWVVSFCQFP